MQIIKSSNPLVKWIGYALLLFISMLAASLLMGEFYVPLKQYLSGQPVDFAEHWQQVDMAKKVPIALLFAAVLTISKYRRERKRQEQKSEA